MKRQLKRSKKKSKTSKQSNVRPVKKESSVSSTLDLQPSQNAQTAVTKKEKRKSSFNLQHWLVAKIRRISYQFPNRKEAIKLARVERGKYKCAVCEGIFRPGEFQLDHVQPVIDPHEGFQNWDTYISRLFCDIDGWQVLCKTCHKYKTDRENSVRKEVKRETNKDDEDDI